VTPHPTSFTTSTPSPHSSLIRTADGSTMTVKNIGTINTPSLSILEVFHVPELSFNLLSIGQLCELGYKLVFYFYGMHVQDPRTNHTLGTEHRIGHMFRLSSLHLPTTDVSAAASSSPPSLTLWHLHRGHASASHVQLLAFEGLLGSISNTNHTLGTEHRIGHMFRLSSLHLPTTDVSAAASSSPPSLALWHSHCGHASACHVQLLAFEGLLGSISNSSFNCILC
jgi:hypothetical protein